MKPLRLRVNEINFARPPPSRIIETIDRYGKTTREIISPENVHYYPQAAFTSNAILAVGKVA